MKILPVFLLALLLSIAAALPAMAIDGDEMFADPAREERAREIGKQLRCLVCQNQSIFDSNANLAKDLRLVVRERIEAGDSDREVLAFVSERYGDYVLLNPPVKQATFVLWAAPLVLLAAALGLGGVYLRRRRVVSDASLSEAESEAAQQLLGKESP